MGNVTIRLIILGLSSIVELTKYIVDKVETRNQVKEYKEMEKSRLNDKEWPGPAIPNKVTIKAMKDVDLYKGVSKTTIEEMKKDYEKGL